MQNLVPKSDLYYFEKNRFFVWKIENFDELQLIKVLTRY